MENKKSFILYIDTYNALKSLPVEEKAQLLDAIFLYNINPENPVGNLGSGAKVAFDFIKEQFKRDNEKYKRVIERNRKNGLNGGRPKTQNNPKKPKKPDSDSDSGNESDKLASIAPNSFSIRDKESLQFVEAITEMEISTLAEEFSLSKESVAKVQDDLKKKILSGDIKYPIKNAKEAQERLRSWISKAIEFKEIEKTKTLDEIVREQVGDASLTIS